MNILTENIKSMLLLEAGRYYISYRTTIEEDSIRNARALAFITSVDFFKNNFHSLSIDSIFEAQLYGEGVKQHVFSIYFFNSLLNELKKGFDNLINDISSKTKKINEDILYLKRITMQNALSREYQYNKTTIINNFKDSGIQNYSNFKDLKTDTILSRSDMLKSRDQKLHLNELESSEILPNEIHLIYEETKFSEILYQNDIYNLLYDSEPHKFIIFYQTSDTQNFEILKSNGEITLVFEFDSPQEINKLRIDTASSSPFLIRENDLKYYSNGVYNPIIFKSESILENIDLYFETIKTNKIKITLVQSKWIEEKTMNGVRGKIFDYSIDRVQFFYTRYQAFGVFRSNELVPVNTPLSLEYSCDFFYEDNDCYTEYYLDLMLYGDSDFDSFNFNKQTEKTIIKQTPRLKSIIAFPRERAIQKELLCFSNDKAKVLFVPYTLTGDLKIFRKTSNELIEIELGDDYLLSSNKGENFSSNPTETTIAGNVYVELIIDTPAKRKQFLESEYYVEYPLKPLFFLNEEKSIWYYGDKIIFRPDLQDSVGFVRPIIIFRTKDYQFDSTSIISSIKIVCEEKELNKDSYIELVDFVEYISQGDGNVVI